jgi:hypothetical protein
MDFFPRLPPERRRELCEEAQLRLGLPAASIEKDFWVCWTLRELFALPEWGRYFTFKGGTALSKGWKLIERFSEDIDIVVDRAFLGFGGDTSPASAPSKKQRRERLAALKTECQTRIHAGLRPALEERIRRCLPPDAPWDLVPAAPEEDPDGQTLLFHYPESLAGTAAYLRPVVKIEMGARSDVEPAGAPLIQPYLADALPDVVGQSAFEVRALLPERTFWEKAMLLHEETYRPPGKARKTRLARHYYDLWSLIKNGVGASAARDTGLFERTAAHRAVYFNWSWMDYGTLRKGSLRIVPLEGHVGEWRQDYEAMRGEMFFGEVPAFDEVLRVVGEFERTFNAG